ncbi:MAG: hypothetical protein COS11_01320 [bacterium (Candidatus Ratteibacteria) CG01_land_8_20_14_3_00_40_19]|uniref:Lipoprotein n=1 Tax=bacterium (Candidatus Ratteibacteria) CG01_land_8_20_14_3_00_40_19 TaxID=2014290 RepID=A0A2M7EA94_9BACT|nr:MAG: hypothetical protein COS11_01320 [bacterium (Candidatus Ratteibacteria) CG01_land_8_20_14_3_00_40_19]
MKKILLGIGILIFSLSLWSGCCKKLPQKVSLNETQIAKALETGRKGKNLNLFEFQREWRSDLGYGVGSSILYTPFHHLALLSRNAEIRGINLPLSLIRKTLKENSEIFHFVVTIYGDSPGFARNCIASLEYESQAIKPIFSKNDQYADVNREQGNVAVCEYKFSSTGINPDAKIILIVTIPKMEGEEEDHILSFPFNLSKIR